MQTPSSVEQIKSRLDEFDRFHTIGIRRRDPRQADLSSELDAFVESLSEDGVMRFRGMGAAWREVDETVAHSIVCRILQYDLAHGTIEIPRGDAASICEAFFGLFDSRTRYFTNGRFSGDGMDWSGWGHVAEATFETGVVAVDSSNIGILWCHDED